MTVEELVKELKVYNPEEEIYIEIRDVENGDELVFNIKEVYVNRSCGYPQICITRYE